MLSASLSIEAGITFHVYAWVWCVCGVTQVDFQDTENKWYTATVIALNLPEDTLHVQFDEWDDTFREWVPSSSPRLAPFRSLSTLRNITYAHTTSDEKDAYSHWRDEKGESVQRGIVGIRNHVNSAVFTSVIQCLAQTHKLTDYFTSHKYLQEINVENPLGYKGELATEFGNVVKRIWINDCKVIHLHTIRKIIETWCPPFAG